MNEETQSNAIQHLLSCELGRRCSKNPSYSQRAFARALGVSHSDLSRVMTGKRSPSVKFLKKISSYISITPETQALLYEEKFGFKGNAAEFRPMKLDTYELISDWIHFALLSLLETEGAKSDPEWIASRLSVSVYEVNSSIQLLKKHGILGIINGKLRQITPPIKVENKISTASTRKTYDQLAHKALYSLENDPMNIRNFSHCTFSMDPAAIPFAIKRIQEFRRSLMQQLEKFGPQKEVYELVVHLFPVSKSKNTKKEK